MYHKNWWNNVDGADLDLEHSSNYSETTGTLWLYLKDEATNFIRLNF